MKEYTICKYDNGYTLVTAGFIGNDELVFEKRKDLLKTLEDWLK